MFKSEIFNFVKKNLAISYYSYRKIPRKNRFYAIGRCLGIEHTMEDITENSPYTLEKINEIMVHHFYNDDIFIEKYKIEERNRKIKEILDSI